MRRSPGLIRRLALLTLTAGLMTAGLTLVFRWPAFSAEDPFKSMAVQRPANPGPAPDLALPALDGETVHIKDFRGKVVLLSFFSTT